MPLMKYFGFVGSALLLLLLGLNWLLPQAVSEPIVADSNRPAILITSAEKLPERVVFDTSLPTIIPPPPMLEFAERWPEVEVADAKPLPRPATQTSNDGPPKTKNLATSQPLKKLATLRPAASMNHQLSSNYAQQVAAPVTRMSLLDIIKDRFSHSFFKLN
jgi:hypothetical protein